MGSCQEKTTFPGTVAGMKRDYLMATGFIPNTRTWNLKLTITNLVYQKSIVGAKTYTTNSMSEQDLYFVYGEADSTINSFELGNAPARAKLGLGAGLAAAGAAY